MRLINTDELRDTYSSVPNGVYTTSHIITAIDECEAIDAAPVKHGRWVVDTKFGNDVLSGGKMVTCSCCGKGGRFDGGSPYCPNCGAKMDLERQENGNE